MCLGQIGWRVRERERESKGPKGRFEGGGGGSVKLRSWHKVSRAGPKGQVNIGLSIGRRLVLGNKFSSLSLAFAFFFFSFSTLSLAFATAGWGGLLAMRSAFASLLPIHLAQGARQIELPFSRPLFPRSNSLSLSLSFILTFAFSSPPPPPSQFFTLPPPTIP